MSRNRYALVILSTLFILLPFAASCQGLLQSRNQVDGAQQQRLVLEAGGGLAAIKSDICKGWACNTFGARLRMGALYKLNARVGVNGGIGYARLGAKEANPAHPLNMSFQTEVIDMTVSGVYNLLDTYSGSGNYRSSRRRLVVPYLMAGLGGIYYTATSYPGQGSLNESQTKYAPARSYPALAAVIPVGGGLRIRLTDQLSLVPELLYHVTSTDFLDNYQPASTRNLIKKDHYGVALLKIQYTPPVANQLLSRKRSKS
ncbi:porin family protein [Pontibacter liquoris]|uniref:porin family protein n=1 Tax=Pontibacter liquoris TaxID=2905677 RepID=UPI001FA7861F|nr:porin family protein [Pontibacter liquoris]